MIASRADVTETQLFRYFRSKAELFKKSILDPLNEHFEQFNARRLGALPITQDWRAGARAYVIELMHFIEAHRDMFMPLIIAQRYAATSVEGVSGVDSLQAYFDISATSMTANLAEGATFDPRLTVRVSFAAVLATVLFRDWLFPDQANQPGEISDALIDFVLDGISAHHPPPDAGDRQQRHA